MRAGTGALILGLTLAIISRPLPSGAQQPAKVPRIGILGAGNPRVPLYVPFDQRLRELGYIEGQNFASEFRTAEGQPERLPELAAELVRLKVDLIFAAGSEATRRAATHATSSIPIVMIAINYDPIARGYVAGLAQPGGNITGLFLRQLELSAKRLELLKEALPKVTRVAALWDVFSADQLQAAQGVARSLGVHVQPLELRNPPYDFEAAFRAAKRGRAGALFIPLSPVFLRERAKIMGLAAKNRLPTISGTREFAEAGALMSYGANLADMFRRAAEYVDKILKGTKPADLPVEQPTRFEMVINLKTMKTLGLDIPQSVLLRVDQVIQ